MSKFRDFNLASWLEYDSHFSLFSARFFHVSFIRLFAQLVLAEAFDLIKGRMVFEAFFFLIPLILSRENMRSIFNIKRTTKVINGVGESKLKSAFLYPPRIIKLN